MAPARRAVSIYEGIWPGIRWFAEAAALADLAPEKIARRIGVGRQVEWLFEEGSSMCGAGSISLNWSST